MTDIVKVCKVHGELTLGQIVIHGQKKPAKRCRICLNEKAIKYREEYREQINLRNRLWKQANKEKQKLPNQIRNQRNYYKDPESRKLDAKQRRQNLNDAYMKVVTSQYFKLPIKGLPQELIEMKKAQLRLKRKISELKDDC